MKIESSYLNKLTARLQRLMKFLIFLSLVMGGLYYYLSIKEKAIYDKQKAIKNEIYSKNKQIYQSWTDIAHLNNSQNVSSYEGAITTTQIRNLIADLAKYYSIFSPINLSIESAKLDSKKIHNYILNLELNVTNDKDFLGFLSSLLKNMNIATQLEVLDIERELETGASIKCLARIKLQTFSASPNSTLRDYSSLISYKESHKSIAIMEKIYNHNLWQRSVIFNK